METSLQVLIMSGNKIQLHWLSRAIPETIFTAPWSSDIGNIAHVKVLDCSRTEDKLTWQK